MKKMLLLMVAGWFGFSCAAQRGNAQIGLKAGVNIANFNDDVPTTDSRIGFHAGLLIHFHVRPNLAIQPEIVYSQQGAEFGNGTQKIEYVNFPFLVQYLFNRGFRLQTGPLIGVRADAEFENNNGLETDNKKSFESTDVSWVFGFGYLSSSGLGVDARYNVGLTDISKGPGEVKNRVWQIGIFYQFKR